MPYILEDLVVNRVDLVDEGANSAAFIEIFKRKEHTEMDVTEILSKMKPEHAEVIQAAIDKAKEDLAKAQEELATATSERDEAVQERDKVKEDLSELSDELESTKTELEEAKKAEGVQPMDETETLKSMPEDVRVMFEKMRAQKETAEEELRKAKDAEQTAEAVAKANSLKAIPVEQEKLVNILKGADDSIVDLLTVVNAALEGVVLDEVGKSRVGGNESDAWAKIESKAADIAKNENITKAKAISRVIKDEPELYREYLQGGAN